MTDERSDAAALAAVATALDDLVTRVVATADRYRGTRSEDVATELYEVERSLRAAVRRLERLVRDRLR